MESLQKSGFCSDRRQHDLILIVSHTNATDSFKSEFLQIIDDTNSSYPNRKIKVCSVQNLSIMPPSSPSEVNFGVNRDARSFLRPVRTRLMDAAGRLRIRAHGEHQRRHQLLPAGTLGRRPAAGPTRILDPAGPRHPPRCWQNQPVAG